MSKGKMIVAAQRQQQPAESLEQVAAEIDAMIAESGVSVCRTVHAWRVKLGAAFLRARKLVPASGPKAKEWGDFVGSRGISTQTAMNWMKLAEYAEREPEKALQGSTEDAYRAIGIKKISQTNFGDPPQVEPPRPPTQDKPKAPPVRVVRDADDSPGDESQEAPEDDGEPVRQVETGYQPLFGGGPGEVLAGKPAPEPKPAWDSLEAVLDRVDGMLTDAIGRDPGRKGMVVARLKVMAQKWGQP